MEPGRRNIYFMTAIRRYWLPITLLIIGLLVALAGVGTATIWRPADTLTLKLDSQDSQQLVIARKGILDLYSSDPTITISGEGNLVLAIGRAEDISGWASDQPYLELTGQDDDNSFLTSSHTSEGEVHSPLELAGQDMWLVSQSGSTQIEYTWEKTEGSWSFLAWGETSSPQISITWHQQVKTPFLWPGIIAGSVIFLLGLIIGIILNRLDSAARKEEAEAARRREALRKEAETGQLPIVPMPALDSVTRPPSRKELRQARERGEETLEVEGVKFPTGLIPVIQTDAQGNPIPPEAITATLASSAGSTVNTPEDEEAPSPIPAAILETDSVPLTPTALVASPEEGSCAPEDTPDLTLDHLADTEALDPDSTDLQVSDLTGLETANTPGEETDRPRLENLEASVSDSETASANSEQLAASAENLEVTSAQSSTDLVSDADGSAPSAPDQLFSSEPGLQSDAAFPQEAACLSEVGSPSSSSEIIPADQVIRKDLDFGEPDESFLEDFTPDSDPSSASPDQDQLTESESDSAVSPNPDDLPPSGQVADNGEPVPDSQTIQPVDTEESDSESNFRAVDQAFLDQTDQTGRRANLKQELALSLDSNPDTTATDDLAPEPDLSASLLERSAPESLAAEALSAKNLPESGDLGEDSGFSLGTNSDLPEVSDLTPSGFEAADLLEELETEYPLAPDSSASADVDPTMPQSELSDEAPEAN